MNTWMKNRFVWNSKRLSMRRDAPRFATHTMTLLKRNARTWAFVVPLFILTLTGGCVVVNTLYGNTALHAAASEGDVQKVEDLLRSGANINAQNRDKETPAYWAVLWSPNPDVLPPFVAAGLDVNAMLPNGSTLLTAAVGIHKHAMTEKLLTLGADVELANSAGETPLMKAADYNDPKPIELLLAHGAKIDRGPRGVTPLMVAAQARNANTVRTLLDHGARVDATTDAGYTPLMAAARGGDTETMTLLLQKNADVHAKNKAGLNALYYAAYNGNTEAIKMLTQRGVALDVDDRGQPSPLHLALAANRPDAAQALLEAGAKPRSITDTAQLTFLSAEAYRIAAEYARANRNDDQTKRLYAEAARIYDDAANAYDADASTTASRARRESMFAVVNVITQGYLYGASPNNPALYTPPTYGPSSKAQAAELRKRAQESHDRAEACRVAASRSENRS